MWERVRVRVSVLVWGFPVHAINCNNSRVFPPLINCCSSIWVAHVPFLQQHRRAAFKEFHPNLLFEMFCMKNENKLETHSEVKISRFAGLTTPTPTHSTFTFTELVSLTFLLISPQGGLRHISSRSLTVCFGLLSTSGQHLTSEQIRIHNPDSAEAVAGLNAGSERVHTSQNYQQESKPHVALVERSWH